MATGPLPLILTAADRLLVGELPTARRRPLPMLFREYILRPDGVEAERGFAVRGFDGRALWLDTDTQQTATAPG
jgi:hypothetical protein